MTKEIYNRAYEMIANGYEFGQIQNGDTWEHLIEGGPYSDIYTCAEKLKEEFGININMGLKYLKMAFKKYVTTHWDDDFEIDESKNMKNVVKLNEAQLRKVVAESVKKVLSEEKYSEEQINCYKKAYNLIEQIEECLSFCHIQNIGKRYNQARDAMIGKNLSNAKKYLRDIIKSKEM